MHILLYDDEDYFDYLDKSHNKIAETFCERVESCDRCPLVIDSQTCIGSIIGEAWRRESNKKSVDN